MLSKILFSQFKREGLATVLFFLSLVCLWWADSSDISQDSGLRCSGDNHVSVTGG